MSFSNAHNTSLGVGPMVAPGTSSANISGVPTSIQGAIPALPNPFTPFAFLPPDAARQYIVSMFIIVASLTVLLWDILSNLRSDYILLAKHRLGLPTVVYFFSRIANAVCLLCQVIFITAPIGNCKTSAIAFTALLPVAIPSTSLLLFFQTRAMYIRNRPIVFLFGVMWIAVIGACSSTLVAATTGTEIGPTEYCLIASPAKVYSAATAIAVLVNDTLMFTAIVYKVFQCSLESSNDIRTGLKTFVSGRSLPRLSKALLQNGQAYFLSTVIINLVAVIIFYIGAIPPAYRSIVGFPDIALMNIMASRIYRNTKLGTFNPPTPAPNSLNNQYSGGVVIDVTKHLEKSPPSMESLNGARMGVSQYNSSSTFNESVKPPALLRTTVGREVAATLV